MPHLHGLLSSGPFYWCLDEAQCYLDAHIPVVASRKVDYHNLFEVVLEDVLLRSAFDFKYQKVIVSGTSLKLQKVISVIKSTQRPTLALGKHQLTFSDYKTITEFPLVTTGERLIDLIKERGLLHKFTPHLEIIKEHGIPLRGRYLWSARYVNRLENLAQQGKLDPSGISTAAYESGNEAKIGLRERLSRLRRENYREILEELCWVVVKSDLQDRPTIFETDKDHQMISEAFAVVKTEGNSIVGVLQEHLAMEAAAEWFREESWDMYRDKVTDYLRQSTNDASSFGKAAECFLALVGTITPV
jgi:hypothetical protein